MDFLNLNLSLNICAERELGEASLPKPWSFDDMLSEVKLQKELTIKVGESIMYIFYRYGEYLKTPISLLPTAPK